MKHLLFKSIIITLLMALGGCHAGKRASDADESKYVVGVYIYKDFPKDVPIDAECFTHVNYAFGVVNPTCDGITIINPECFERVVKLKDTYPRLKVLLSLGGLNAIGFSRMATDSVKRVAFANDCARVIKRYGIDGIDLDWKYPCNSAGTPDDYNNYVKLVRDIRQSIGDKKILSAVTGGDLPGINAPAISPYIDYFNVLCYDLGWPPYHHTSLFRSQRTGWRSIDEIVAYYNSQGVPNEKIVLGVAFYGRGDEINCKGWVEYGDIKLEEGQSEQWDDVAKVPYIIDADSAMVLAFENSKSLKIKCDYIKAGGFKGAFAWRYACDDVDGTLRHALAEGLYE